MTPLETLRDEIEVKQHLLKQLELAEKKNKPSLGFKFRRGYLKTLKVLTSPFAEWNVNAINASQVLFKDYEADKLIKTGDKLLKKLKNIPSDEKGKHDKLVIKAASLVMKLEDINAGVVLAITEDLDKEIQRLRSEVDEKKRAEAIHAFTNLKLG